MRVRLSKLIRFVLCALAFLSFLVLIFFVHLQSNTINDNISILKAEKIDWEDYVLSRQEKSRRGPGEHGIPVRLSSVEAKNASNFVNENGFNTYISSMIKVDRAIKDIRHPKCRGHLYSSVLPTASIVIPFFEEHWETLLRTFVSALKRSPPKLVKEVILVDDGSSRPYLKQHLDNYLKEWYRDGKVRVIHLPERKGLITARLVGAKEATGDVLIFLDSHCEASANWLPPLLHPIAENYKTVVCPFIDVIDADTFEYRAQDEGARGAFDWELYYKRLPRLPSDRFHPEEPFDSPVMAGGLFAISRKWFWELGGYDPGLVIWGGEQYELSFKIWMCGGHMIDTPCSRIGHIYRKYQTSFPNPGIGDFVGRNYKRVAEVWMDEYKEYIYKRRPHYRELDPGDLSVQKSIRERLKCKTFHWFMTKVAFDLTKKYPLIDPISAAVGLIRSVADSSVCIDTQMADENTPVKLKICNKDTGLPGDGQNLEFSYYSDIRDVKNNRCFDVPAVKRSGRVNFYPCHRQGGNQRWRIIPANNDKSNPVRIIHSSNKCLDCNPTAKSVFVSDCDPSSATQNWHWEKLQFDEAVDSLRLAGL